MSERLRHDSRVPLAEAVNGRMLDNKTLKSNPAAVKSWPHLVAGASGGFATTLVTSPLDVVRTRLQSDIYQSTLRGNEASQRYMPKTFRYLRVPLLHFKETFQILFAVRQQEGWRGLFRGLGPNLTGVVPASAIKFYAYGNCKRIVSDYTSWGKDAAAVHIISAASSSIATSTATNPIWVVKTRLQLDISRAADGMATRRYKNTLDCVLQILTQEGFRGMYRGLGASYLGALETTLHLAMYEQMKLRFARGGNRARESSSRAETLWDQTVDWLGTSGAGGISKLVAILIGYPHEVVRTRLRQAPMQDGRQKYSGVVNCFRTIWKEEGLASMYGGFTPHILRSVPSAAITLGVKIGLDDSVATRLPKLLVPPPSDAKDTSEQVEWTFSPDDIRSVIRPSEPISILYPLSELVATKLGGLDAHIPFNNLSKLLHEFEVVWTGPFPSTRAFFRLGPDIIIKAVYDLEDLTEYTTLHYLERNAPKIPAPKSLGAIRIGRVHLLFMSLHSGDDARRDLAAPELRSKGTPLGGVAGEGCKDLHRSIRCSREPISTAIDFERFQFSNPIYGSNIYINFLRSFSQAQSSRCVFTRGGRTTLWWTSPTTANILSLELWTGSLADSIRSITSLPKR
ncbi:MAG: hypothetical protein M1825_001176 [Sarcosagium campestre]|nr:MAG: hypothetical protein M1825_001176 [Sarcosagium campestre]